MARKWDSIKPSKAHCFESVLIDRYSFVFIPVDNKRLFDPSGLLYDVYLCFRIPGTPPYRFVRV